MNKILQLIALSLFTLKVTAQIDEVSIGASYGKQAFYALSTGEVFQLNNEDWDISFSNMGNQDAGIFINESAKSSGVPLKLFLSKTTTWDEKIASTTEFVDSVQLYNKS
jgi:hypothetical protein